MYFIITGSVELYSGDLNVVAGYSNGVTSSYCGILHILFTENRLLCACLYFLLETYVAVFVLMQLPWLLLLFYTLSVVDMVPTINEHITTCGYDIMLITVCVSQATVLANVTYCSHPQYCLLRLH